MMMLDSLERRRLMKPAQRSPSFVSRTIVVAILLALSAGTAIAQTADPLPSWKPGAARQSIVDFVRPTTDPASPQFVPVEERIFADRYTWFLFRSKRIAVKVSCEL